VGTGTRLGLVLGLFAATAGAVYLPPPIRDSGVRAALYALPSGVEGWTGSEGVPEAILPLDPHEMGGIRLTFHERTQTGWVSVAWFTHQDDPTRRASIEWILPQRSASRIDRVPLAILLPEPPRAFVLPAVVIHQPHQLLLVVYWHQIGRYPYGNDYWFRWARLRRMLFMRQGDSFLIRVAIPVSSPEKLPESLKAAENLARAVYRALSERVGE
jgi:hypothetical protein